MWSDDTPKGFGERCGLVWRKNYASARAASKAAGLSPGHVTTFEVGETSPTARTVEKMATAWGVPIAWLAHGIGPVPWEGEPDESPPATDDARYPNRAVAAKLVRGRVDPETIDALLSMRLDSDRDLTVGEWALEARTLQDIRDGLASTEAVEIDDAPRLRPKRDK